MSPRQFDLKVMQKFAQNVWFIFNYNSKIAKNHSISSAGTFLPTYAQVERKTFGCSMNQTWESKHHKPRLCPLHDGLSGTLKLKLNNVPRNTNSINWNHSLLAVLRLSGTRVCSDGHYHYSATRNGQCS